MLGLIITLTRDAPNIRLVFGIRPIRQTNRIFDSAEYFTIRQPNSKQIQIFDTW